MRAVLLLLLRHVHETFGRPTVFANVGGGKSWAVGPSVVGRGRPWVLASGQSHPARSVARAVRSIG
jgi:hypothetical protein